MVWECEGSKETVEFQNEFFPLHFSFRRERRGGEALHQRGARADLKDFLRGSKAEVDYTKDETELDVSLSKSKFYF